MGFDAIVVGSGFGGAVCACRLAQAGLSVAVIERGKRYDGPGAFPRALDGWLYSADGGLFDIKPIQEMMIVEAAGWGGGSLIYANVHLRCPEAVFARGWPSGYSRAALDPHYDLVAYMLDIKPITSASAVPAKTKAMTKVAADLGRSQQLVYPNLAVTFESGTNHFGVAQTECNHCGECVIGCRTRSKNTLDLNYLHVAEEKGAKVFTERRVVLVAPRDDGWDVHLDDGSIMQARAVFLCAGAINSTEILLRSALPNVSPQLGTRYSGNGDFLGFAYGTQAEIDTSKGPTITSGIVYDDGQTWFILEEGGYPKELAWLIETMRDPIQPNALRDEIDDAVRRKFGKPGTFDGKTAVFLSMGRDRADGRIELVLDQLRIAWDVPSNQLLYDTQARLNTDVAKALGGDVGFPPTWKLLHQPVSVHNLGGCVMADSPDRGVIDANGEVFGHRNLYIMDGAALPSSTGVNPSHTIAAVAERNVEIAIRRLTGDPAWTAPERKVAKPIVDPLSSIAVPSAPPKTQSVGIRFRELLRGMQMDVDLTITIPDLDRFLADPNHAAIANGKVNGSPVTNGVFNLYGSEIVYALPFFIDGRPYLLDGKKELTKLHTNIREGHSRRGRITSSGILETQTVDSLHTIGAHGILDRAAAIARFGELFVGVLWKELF